MLARFENAELTGRWTYYAGISGTVSIPTNARVVGISVVCNGDPGSVSIDGGASIPVPANAALNINPAAQLFGPFDIVFDTTESYFVEVIT